MIAHMGDVHFRDTQYGTAKRGLDFCTAALNAVTSALQFKRRPHCFVIAGDIFDSSRPSPRAIGQLMALDALFRQHNVPAFAVTGNHDWSTPTWLETLFPAPPDVNGSIPHGGIVPLDGKVIEFRGFRIAGVQPYTTKQFLDGLDAVAALTHDADVWIYHNFVTGVVPCYTGEKRYIDIQDLPVSERNKAVLLGDIHVQGFVENRGALIGYPGSTEICSASEHTEKSVPVLSIPAHGTAAVVGYAPIKTRPAVIAKVETEEDLETVVARVKELAPQHPLVHIDFNRDVQSTFTRLHALLDHEQAILRCYPLPARPVGYERLREDEEADALPFSHFLSAMFEDSDLEPVVTALYQRPEDAANTLTAFIEAELQDQEL